MAKARDEAEAAAGPQPAAPVPAPDSANRARAAEDRAKLVERIEAAEIAKNWHNVAFFDNPTGAVALLENLLVDGITAGRYTMELVQQWFQDPANLHEIMTILSLSVPGQQRAFLEDLESWNPDAVVHTYIQGLYDSVNGDLSLLAQIGDLSLKGDAPPAPAQVRRASLLPSAGRLVPHVARRELAGFDRAADKLAAGPAGL